MRAKQTRALLVHFFTAAGLVPAFFAVSCILEGDFRSAYLAMLVATVIDAIDGTLARWADVNRHVPWIDGAKLDDIVDYVNYTFVPVLLIWKAGWLPNPAWLWCCIPLFASVLAFVHTGAKESRRGFFRGFPSYWNIVALYCDLLHDQLHDTGITITIVFLSGLSLAPVKFVYPNRPPCWKPWFLGGACVWAAALLTMVPFYPRIPLQWTLTSLLYPLFYVIASLYLDRVVPAEQSR